MPKLYILKNKTPVEVDSLQEWAAWFDSTDRRVLVSGFMDIGLKTVFVGLDFTDAGKPPLLYVCIVFLPDGSQIIVRQFPTWAEAETGHFEIFEDLKQAWKNNNGLSETILERLT